MTTTENQTETYAEMLKRHDTLIARAQRVSRQAVRQAVRDMHADIERALAAHTPLPRRDIFDCIEASTARSI